MPEIKPWSEEEVETLKRMVSENASATMIAKALKRTRSSVNSKAFAHRLTFSFRSTRETTGASRPEISSPGRAPTTHTRPLTAKEFADASIIPIFSHDYRPWEDRAPGECAAPVGVFDGSVHSCCRPIFSWRRAGRLIESSYCKDHHRLFFYTPATSARDLERSITRLRTRRAS